MIRNFIKGIKNLIYFFPVIWSDRDWDWVFLLKLMDKKMRKMSKYQKEHGISMNNEDYAKELMIAAELCRRLTEHDYDEYYRKKHKEKWGDIYHTSTPYPDNPRLSTVNFGYTKVKTDYEYKKASEESMDIAKMEEQRIKNEIDYLFTLMRKKIRTWWD